LSLEWKRVGHCDSGDDGTDELKMIGTRRVRKRIIRIRLRQEDYSKGKGMHNEMSDL